MAELILFVNFFCEWLSMLALYNGMFAYVIISFCNATISRLLLSTLCSVCLFTYGAFCFTFIFPSVMVYMCPKILLLQAKSMKCSLLIDQ